VNEREKMNAVMARMVGQSRGFKKYEWDLMRALTRVMREGGTAVVKASEVGPDLPNMRVIPTARRAGKPRRSS
jgi:hypothetical protein